MKSETIKLGDFVSIRFSNGISAIGVVVKDRDKWNGRRGNRGISPEVRQSIIDNPMPNVLRVRLGEWETESVFAEECRKLTRKEVFKAKLSDDWDYNLKYDDISI